MKLGPLQTKWVEALESGKYEQGKSFLKLDNEYCCLGIAAEHVLNIEPVVHERGISLFKDNCSSLPDYEKLGLRTSFGDFGYFKEDYSHSSTCITLSSMNDGGVSFEEIAKFIRENPEVVFTKSA